MELAGGTILDGAASAELAALLDGIGDISFDASPKFTPATRHALLRLIVGRAYAPPLLELCHLLRVAALAPRRRFEQFFWGVDLARAGAYAGWARTHLKRASAAQGVPRVEAEPGGVAILYPDGRFAISYGRMPLLVALMEFLVSSIGYPAVLERVEALLAGPPQAAAAGQMANELSRTVYAWLAPHLPTAHENRRLEALVTWLSARFEGRGRADGRSFTTDDIDDDAVLAFWLAAEDADFRTFASVLRGFMLLADAMEHAASVVAVGRAASLGTDAEAGEIDVAAPDMAPADALTPDAVAADGVRASDMPHAPGGAGRVVTAEQVDPGADPLAALAEPPADGVKALNARERAELEQLLESGPRGERLVLSLLRRAVFGAVQARISEALRRGGLPAAARVLGELIEAEAAPQGKDAGPRTYPAWCARYDELGAHVERVMLASLHVLTRAGDAAAVHLLVATGGGLDLRAALRDAAAGETGRPDLGRLVARLQDPTVAGPEIAALMLRARRSFQGLSRAGFEPDAPARPEAVAGHVAAAPQLPRLAARLARAREALARRPRDAWAAQQEADRRLFVARFAEIYGIMVQETSP